MIYAIAYLISIIGIVILSPYSDMDSFVGLWMLFFPFISVGYNVFYILKKKARTSEAVFTYIGTFLSFLLPGFYSGDLIFLMLKTEDLLLLNFIAALSTLIFAIAKDSVRRKKKSDETSKLTVAKRERSLFMQTFFGAASYVAAVGLSFCYMYFVDVESGMIIFFIMLLVPLISLVLTLIARVGLQTDISASAEQINKGETVTLTISVTKKTVIPAPFIDLVLELSPGFMETDFDTCRIAMSVNKTTEIAIPLKGKICGRSNVGLHSVVISDYLSIFRFGIKSAKLLTLPIDIIPDIKRDIDCQELFSELSAHISYSDEEEATKSLYTTNASPGYEHREYVPGDPLKRVNWKLSSKRSTLMVRLDEAPAMIRPIMVMDYVAEGYNDDVDALYAFERMCETVLALTDLCSRQSMECSIFWTDGKQLNQFGIDSGDAVKRLALQLGSIDALKTFGTQRCLSDEDIAVACERAANAVLISNSPVETLMSAAHALESRGVNVATVSDKESDGLAGFVIKQSGIIMRAE